MARTTKQKPKASQHDELAAALGASSGDRLSDRTRATVDKGITAIDERIDAITEKIRAADSRDDASRLATYSSRSRSWKTSSCSGA